MTGHDGAGEALRNREMMEAAPDVICGATVEGILIFVNRAFETLTGWSRGEWIGRPFWPLVHPEDLSRARTRLDQASRGESPPPDELRIRTRHGDWLVIEFAATPHVQQGEVIVVGVGRDVSQRRRSEDLLRAAEERLRFLISATPAILYAGNPSPPYTTTFISENVRQQLGYEPRRFTEDAGFWSAHIHPDDAPRAREHHDVAEYRFRHADGTWRWMRDESRLVHDANGRPVEVIGYWLDITDRKQAEATLRKSEERYRAVVEDQTEVISRFLPDGTFTFVNEVYCRFFGKSAEELLGKRWQPVAVPDDLPYVEEKLRTLSPSNPMVVIENRVHGGDGRVYWLQFVNRAFFDAAGRLVETQAVGRDITQQKRLEEELRRSAERFRVALAAAPIVVFNQDRELRYTWVGNPALGTRTEEALGRTDDELLGVEMAVPLTAIKRRVLQTGRGERQEVHLVRNAAAGDFDLMVEPLRDANGEIVGITCAAVDIAERKQLEAERAAALTRLAVVQEEERQRISRELHDQTAQRLVALAVELKNLEMNLAADRPQITRVRSLRTMVDELQRQVRQIAWDLRAGELVDGDFETALRGYVEEWSERARVPVDCECLGLGHRRLPTAVEATLYRIAQETLANVERHAQARRVSVLLECDEALARLTVEDDGRGFDADAVLKSPEAARRLGLLGMKERVSLAGGTLLIESSPGAGTTVLVRIPIPAEGMPS